MASALALALFTCAEIRADDVASVQNASTAVYTLPLTVNAPVVDGTLAEGEYVQAGAMTGFVQGTGLLSPRQTSVWYCHDEACVYVAFSTIFESQGPPELGRAGVLELSDISTGDLFELWLSTPETQRQYIVNLNQGIFSYDYTKKGPADGEITFKGTFASNPFLVGGKWQGEFAIPKSLLPGCDKGLSLLFCRDFAGNFGRSEADWTSSTPMNSEFSRVERHPKGRLSSDGAHVAVSGFGEWSIGEATVHGRLDGFSHPLQLTWRLVDGDGTVILDKTCAVPNGDFTVGERLKTSTAISGNAHLQIADPETGEVVHAQDFGFVCGSPLQFKCLPLIGDAALVIGFDTQGIPELPAGTVAKIDVLNGDEKVASYDFPLEGEPRRYEFRQDAAGFTYQGYRIECRLMHDGKELYAAAEPDVWLGTPPWSRRNDPPLGIPEPWTPLRAADRRVEMLARTYALTDSGLPAAITALDREILSSPARLSMSVNGRKEPIAFEPLELLEGSNGEQLRYAIRGQSADLQVEGILTIDYDGFARWQTAFTAKSDLTLDSLAISWAMPEERALYARGNIIGGLPGGYAANLDNDGPRKDAEFIANTIHSSTGWPWSNVFFYNFMMGDDETGLSFMTESDRFHRGQDHFAINRKGDVQQARLTLTSKHALKAGETIDYDYAWCGLPLKIMPTDPKWYHHGIVATRDIDVSLMDVDADFFHQIPLAGGANYLRHDSYWEMEERELLKRRVPNLMPLHDADFVPGLERALENGCQVITGGVYYAAMNTALDISRRHQAEWKVMPSGYSWQNFEEALNLAACTNSSWNDYIETVCRRILDETPIQGVYLDVATEEPCNSELHGCGYVDEQGTRRPAMSVWGIRDLHRRVYTYYHTGGRNGKTFHHYLNNAAWAGFCDEGFQGEDWSIYQDYKKIRPDFFRAMQMTQYGTPYTFFAMFLYWQCGDLKEVMSICLPHRIYPAVWAYRKDNYPEIKPYWAAMDPWWCDSTFVPYWRPQPPTDAPHDKDILASAFIKPGKAMLTVGNWRYEDASLSLNLNPDVLPGKVVRAQDALSKEEIRVNADNSLAVSIPKRDIVLIELTFE